MALLLNLNTSRRLYLVYLHLVEYIVVPYVQRSQGIINAIYIYIYIYIYIFKDILIIVDIVLDYFLTSG